MLIPTELANTFCVYLLLLLSQLDSVTILYGLKIVISEHQMNDSHEASSFYSWRVDMDFTSFGSVLSENLFGTLIIKYIARKNMCYNV